MFERYTEKGRRVVFFARYESSQFGTPSIETEHLLLGLFREDKALAHRFLPSSATIESIRRRVQALTPVRDKISTSVDLPLSRESKRVLVYSAEEADRLGHPHIGTEHMLLGLLREEAGLAASILKEQGLSVERVREELKAQGADSSDNPRAALQTTLLKYLESHQSELGISAAGSHIYVRPDRLPVTLPFLLIKILSADDRLCEVRDRIDEHLAFGLRYVWLFDPDTHHVYIATHESGLCEFNGDILRTENPVLELPLSKIFP